MSIDCWPNLLTKTSCSSPHSALPRQLLQSPRPKTLARCHCHDQHPCFWKFVNFFFSSFKVSVVACRLNVSNVCAMLPNHVFQVESFDDYCIKQQPPPLDPYSDCLSFKMMTTARKSFKFFVRQDKSFPPTSGNQVFLSIFVSFVKFLVLKISLSWSENKSFWLYIVFLKQISLSSNNQNVFLSSMDVNFIKVFHRQRSLSVPWQEEFLQVFPPDQPRTTSFYVPLDFSSLSATKKSFYVLEVFHPKPRSRSPKSF